MTAQFIHDELLDFESDRQQFKTFADTQLLRESINKQLLKAFTNIYNAC